jgi:hypothetical protein
VHVEPRRRRLGEHLLAEPLERRARADPPRLGKRRRRERDPVAEHRQDQLLDVRRDDERPAAEERGRPRRALEREAPAHRRADDDRVERARGLDEAHDPALD